MEEDLDRVSAMSASLRALPVLAIREESNSVCEDVAEPRSQEIGVAPT